MNNSDLQALEDLVIDGNIQAIRDYFGNLYFKTLKTLEARIQPILGDVYSEDERIPGQPNGYDLLLDEIKKIGVKNMTVFKNQRKQNKRFNKSLRSGGNIPYPSLESYPSLSAIQSLHTPTAEDYRQRMIYALT
jgi:hypothetical protein